MKFAAVVALLGVASATQAVPIGTALAQIESKVGHIAETEDQLVQTGEPCVYLDETKEELDW